MLVVNRFRVDPAGAEAFRGELESAHAALAGCAGYRAGTVGRNVDDPDLWVLTTLWDNVGAYRRALSSYDVKVGAWQVLGRALDEPGAYEVVEPGRSTNDQAPRGSV